MLRLATAATFILGAAGTGFPKLVFQQSLPLGDDSTLKGCLYSSQEHEVSVEPGYYTFHDLTQSIGMHAANMGISLVSKCQPQLFLLDRTVLGLEPIGTLQQVDSQAFGISMTLPIDTSMTNKDVVLHLSHGCTHMIHTARVGVAVPECSNEFPARIQRSDTAPVSPEIANSAAQLLNMKRSTESSDSNEAPPKRLRREETIPTREETTPTREESIPIPISLKGLLLIDGIHQFARDDFRTIWSSLLSAEKKVRGVSYCNLKKAMDYIEPFADGDLAEYEVAKETTRGICIYLNSLDENPSQNLDYETVTIATVVLQKFARSGLVPKDGKIRIIQGLIGRHLAEYENAEKTVRIVCGILREQEYEFVYPNTIIRKK